MAGYSSVGLDEIVGLSEIVGAADVDDLLAELSGDDDDDDDDEVSGPAVKKIAKLARAMQRARNVDPNAVSVRTEVDSRRRRLVLGGDKLAVAAGADFTLEIKPQRLFRGERMTVGSSIAPFFVLTDVKIGQSSQFAATGPISCESLTEQAKDCYVHFDTANVGNTITITGTNVDVAAHDFRITIFGTATVR